jgi:RNA polymerase sigma-70 factor (ECF subfamily)
MCFLYLCDKTLAEDAVQETFVKVYRGLNSFHGQSSIKTWIMKIAIRTCYDMNHSETTEEVALKSSPFVP